jgi:hypothetical protein
MRATLTKTAAPFARGDLVEVREQGIRPWVGPVGAVKWSPVSGWWVEVRREGVGTYTIREDDLARAEEGES